MTDSLSERSELIERAVALTVGEELVVHVDVGDEEVDRVTCCALAGAQVGKWASRWRQTTLHF